VRKVVIPAAGLGTRFLPATKAQPKEMLPIVDRPAIQYVVEEAVEAGLRDVTIVTGRSKRSIEDHFDRSIELEWTLEQAGKTAELAEVQAIARMAHLHYVRQHEPRGLGHAVSVAKYHVGDEPFVVMLGDDLMVDATVLKGMIDAYNRTGCSIIAFMKVGLDRISSYGCATPAPPQPGDPEGLVRLAGLVEKPHRDDAPSDLAVMGRYLFTPRIFEHLERTTPGKGGEIQLTDAIATLLQEEPVYGFVFEHGRYDTGQKLDFLKATVEFALARPDLGPGFEAYLRELTAAWRDEPKNALADASASVSAPVATGSSR
jgi:UTP--glucose-1-phosphate uridylyltransferase